MGKVIFSIVILLFSVTSVFALECPIGYVPSVAAFNAGPTDLNRMELSGADRTSAEDKAAALRDREEKLQSEYHDHAAELAMTLAAGQADRSRVDSLVSRMEEILAELSDLRTTYTMEIAEILKVRNLRNVRSRAKHWSSFCDMSIPVPRMRLALTGREKTILALTEDELRYLKDFDKRESYFRVEQQLLRQRLGSALQARDIDRNRVKDLLGQLAASIRQQVTIRLDRYFYSENVLLSPERMKKIDEYHAKHMKHVKVNKK